MSKFRVGDRVEHNDYGKGTIVEIDTGSSKDLILVQFDNPEQELHNGNGESKGKYKGEKCWYFNKLTDKLIKISDTQFTKSNIQNGDIITYRKGEKRTVIGKKLLDEYGEEVYDLDEYKSSLKDKDLRNLDIVKVERPVKYETVFERKEEILDEVEKKYLASVIRPFRDKVEGIRKISRTTTKSYLRIVIKDDSNIIFPDFEVNTMYQGMKASKTYTLEELGL